MRARSGKAGGARRAALGAHEFDADAKNEEKTRRMLRALDPAGVRPLQQHPTAGKLPESPLDRDARRAMVVVVRHARVRHACAARCSARARRPWRRQRLARRVRLISDEVVLGHDELVVALAPPAHDRVQRVSLPGEGVVRGPGHYHREVGNARVRIAHRLHIPRVESFACEELTRPFRPCVRRRLDRNEQPIYGTDDAFQVAV